MKWMISALCSSETITQVGIIAQESTSWMGCCLVQSVTKSVCASMAFKTTHLCHVVVNWARGDGESQLTPNEVTDNELTVVVHWFLNWWANLFHTLLITSMRNSWERTGSVWAQHACKVAVHVLHVGGIFTFSDFKGFGSTAAQLGNSTWSLLPTSDCAEGYCKCLQPGEEAAGSSCNPLT